MDAAQELGPGVLVAGRYRIHGLIGRGGMSTIWRATDQTLDRQVAIKSIRIDNQPDIDRALTCDRVRREARIAAMLHHPGIVTIFNIVERDGPCLILGSGTSGTQVTSEFRRVPLPGSYGEPTDFNGRPGRLVPQNGSCNAHIVHDDTAIGGSTARVDAVVIRVWAPRSAGDVCGYAATIANAAAPNLPPPG